MARILNSGSAPSPATPASFAQAFTRLRESSSPFPEEYLQAARGLREMEAASLSAEPVRRAFFLNLYNAMVLHGVQALGLRKSVWERPGFFHRVRYEVAGRVLSLHAVENGVLRGNRRPSLGLLPPFAPGDPRRALSLPLDPRIHFALNCGAASCPPIRFYEAGKLEEQLDMATRAFIAAETHLDPGARRVRVSRIFQFYARDFGDVRGLLGRYLGRDLQGWRIEYAHYDWSLGMKPA